MSWLARILFFPSLPFPSLALLCLAFPRFANRAGSIDPLSAIDKRI